jgi:hypothetical protein
MTDNATKLDDFDTFERTLGKRMERIFEQAMLGEVDWDHDRWSNLLAWIQGPLRRRMYSGWLADNPGKNLEQHPAYVAFEQFDRARLQGLLDDSNLIRVVFAAVKEMVDLEKDGLKYFGVRFAPPKSGLEKELESRV